MAWFRYPLGLIVATLFMTVLGVIIQTQFVLGALSDAGAVIGMADRLAMTRDDLMGFGPLYAVFILIGFLVAFSVSALLLRFVKLPRTIVYAVAGAVCMFVMLMLMREVFFGVPVIAGARSLAGELAQTVCGAAAGWLYAALTARKS
ncbi:MAG: hypothetical protein JJU26_11270 [Oceanicaulis sp.]|uniref:hypothetical protein n=1 Tax=Glycocaulis sp. TaxID=1969725 RepID=UPI0025C0493E|nr:hypothetical protein [Glycocaulis sp.]MCC5982285.1 hypothetical protein [Oceanicaulis sp.]MCH8520719.1 hypothetical protein [Glycocaulis sp.]